MPKMVKNRAVPKKGINRDRALGGGWGGGGPNPPPTQMLYFIPQLTPL